MVHPKIVPVDTVEDDDDDDLQLPADTLALLGEFLKDRDTREARETDTTVDQDFEEDWQLSQFWYNEKTKNVLAKVCRNLLLQRTHGKCSTEVKIGLLSCPSLYRNIRSIHAHGVVRLFEIDKRFAAVGDDFCYYDYREIANDTDYLNEFANTFDILIVDPPFLSEECMQHTATIVNKLKADNASIILCSGGVVASYAEEFFHLKQCEFRPGHARNLANEFCSYANFDLDSLIN